MHAPVSPFTTPLWSRFDSRTSCYSKSPACHPMAPDHLAQNRTMLNLSLTTLHPVTLELHKLRESAFIQDHTTTSKAHEIKLQVLSLDQTGKILKINCLQNIRKKKKKKKNKENSYSVGYIRYDSFNLGHHSTSS